MQVVVVRGLCASWKQIVYYDFDTNMEKVILFDIISRLEKIGINVVAVVSDMGGKNSVIHKQLDISYTQSSFINPVDPSRKIWVFADVPHLLKLLRNHFIDEGFLLPSGNIVNKRVIEQLLSEDSGEFKISSKLTRLHIDCKNRERQRVKLAAQLFSHHTAEAVRYVFPEDEETAYFLQLVNDVFDIFNSDRPDNVDKPLNAAFGNNLRDQLKVLHKFKNVCEKMRACGKKALLPFQRGFLMSIRSLKGVFTQVKSLNGQYVLTTHLNQDALENTFSRIRGLGHFYDHPLPSEVRNRIRLLILGAEASNIPVSSAAPVSQQINTSTFITSVLFIENGLCDSDDFIESILLDFENRTILKSNDTDSNLSSVDCPAEGFRYLAGYVAFKSRLFDRSLGNPTGSIHVDNAPPQLSWIGVISRGGLLVPSEHWLSTMKEMEVTFSTYHGDSFCKDKFVIKKLCFILEEKFPAVNKKTIQIYARVRTFIRIRHLNSETKKERVKRAQIAKNKKWQKSKV